MRLTRGSSITKPLQRAIKAFVGVLGGLVIGSLLFRNTPYPPAGLMGVAAITAVATWARERQNEGTTPTGRDRMTAGLIACAVTLSLSSLTSLAFRHAVDWLDVGIAVSICALFSLVALVRRWPTADRAV